MRRDRTRNTRILTTFRATLLAAAIGSLAAAPAGAGVITWDGGGPNNNLANDNNWNPNGAPSNGDDLEFKGTTRLNPNNNFTNLDVRSIFFSDPAGAFTLGGNDLTITTSGNTNGLNNLTDQSQTINVGRITLGNDQQFQQSTAAGSLIINSEVATSGNALTFDAAAGSTSTINGQVRGGGSLTKTGDGALVLTDTSNSYSGGTAINGGVLSIADNGALGAGSGSLSIDGGTLNTTADTTVSRLVSLGAGGGTLDTDSGTTLTHNTALSGAGALTKTGGGTLVLQGANSYGGGTAIRGGTVEISADNILGVPGGGLTLDGGTLKTTADIATSRLTVIEAGSGGGFLQTASGTTLTHSGNISGAGFLTKSGTGTLVLQGDNTHSTTRIFAGTLEIGAENAIGANAGALADIEIFNATTLKSTASFSLSKDITLFGNAGINTETGTTLTATNVIDGTGRLIKTGAGTLALTTSNSYSGGTTISGGTLSVDSNNRLGDTSGDIVLNNATLKATANFTTGRDTTLNGVNSTIEVNSARVLTHNGVIGGTGSLTKTGGGELKLTQDNTYTGNTSVLAGILAITAENQLGADGNVLNIGNTGTLRTDADITLSRNIGLGNVTGGRINTNGNTVTHSGLIFGGTLTKNGTGTLVLTTGNTYTGGTVINNGTVEVDAATSLGQSGTDVTLDGGTLRTTGSFNNARQITFGATSGGTIETASGTTLTMNGAALVSTINKTGLRKTGDGTLDIRNADVTAHQGDTVLLGGTLLIGADSDLGLANSNLTFGGGTLQTTASTTISSDRSTTLNGGGGTLAVNAGETLTYKSVITGSGLLTIDGPGTVLLTNPNTYSGGTAITGGELVITKNTQVGNTSKGIAFDGGTLNYQDTGGLTRNLTVNAGGGTLKTETGLTISHTGTIGGAGAFSKTGGGRLILSGNNSHSGGTSVLDGTLQIAADDTLGAAGAGLTLAGGVLNTTADISTSRAVTLGAGDGTFTTDSGTTLTLTGDVGGSGRLFKDGGGTLSLDGASGSHAGGTTVNAGTLSIGADAHLGTSGTNLVVNNATLQTRNTLTTARSATIAGDAAFDTDSGTTLTYDGTIAGGGRLVKQGAGTLSLGANNSYSGGTAIDGGTVSISHNNRLGAGGTPLSFDGGTLQTTADVSTSRDTTLNLGGGTFRTDSGTTLTNNSIIDGVGRLTKTGDGTMVINGSNTYAGGTEINGGTVSIASNDALGAAASDLTINGGTLNTTATFASSRNTFLLAAGGTFDSATGTAFTQSGAITGAGGLTKTGGGTLRLDSTGNSFSGGTSVTGGTLQVSSDSNLGSGALSIDGATLETLGSFVTARTFNIGAGGATFRTAAGTTLNHTGGLSGSGAVTKEGAGELVLTGINALGPIAIDGGALTVGAGSSISTAVTTLSGGTLNASLVGAGLPFGDYQSAVISGHGTVNAAVIGSAFGQIVASGGSLTLGNASSGFGFAFDGTLDAGAEDVVLNSVALATLGTTNTLNGGTLSAANGMQLAAGRALTGNGTVNDRFINQGTVDGLGAGLTFTGDVSGAGDFLGTTIFDGTFRPGNSPAQVVFENIVFDGTLEMEIGGLTAGTEYDQLIGTATAFSTATLGGTLDIDLIGLGGGPTFLPASGNFFDLIVADDIVGDFSLTDFPSLMGGLFFTGGIFDYGDGREVYRLTVAENVASVPAPAPLLILIFGAAAMAGLRRARAA